MINYTWNCKTVEVYPTKGEYTNVVYNIHYYVEGEDSESLYSSELIGNQLLNTSNTENFKPFSELTNETAVAWCKAAMGEHGVTGIESVIAKNIEDELHPASLMLVIGDEPG